MKTEPAPNNANLMTSINLIKAHEVQNCDEDFAY